MTDIIQLTGLEFYGHHGLFDAEKQLGQRFIIDLAIQTNMEKAGETDNMADSVHYGEVYTCTKEIVEGEPFNLLEALTTAIGQTLLKRFLAIEAVTVTTHKPNAPIPGVFKDVAVQRRFER